MKKLFLLLAVVAMTVACGATSVEGKAEKYCLKIIEALQDLDVDEADDLTDELDEWMDSLSDSDFDIADEVVCQYEDKIDALYELAELAEEASDLDW